MHLEFGWENFSMVSPEAAPPCYLLRIAALNVFVYLLSLHWMSWLLNEFVSLLVEFERWGKTGRTHSSFRVIEEEGSSKETARRDHLFSISFFFCHHKFSYTILDHSARFDWRKPLVSGLGRDPQNNAVSANAGSWDGSEWGRKKGAKVMVWRALSVLALVPRSRVQRARTRFRELVFSTL